MVEQNARLALKFARRGYVIENGNLVLEGPANELLENPEVKKADLGGKYYIIALNTPLGLSYSDITVFFTPI